MTFRLTNGKVTIECDSAAEAFALMSVAAAEGVALGSTEGPDRDPVRKLRRELSGRALQVVELLADSASPLETDELAKLLNIKAHEIKHVIRTVKSTARKLGVADEVIMSKRMLVEGKLKSQYSVPSRIKEAFRA